jgi:ribosome-associated translation inhibitor RaiA
VRYVTTKVVFKGLDRSPAVEERVDEHVIKLADVCPTISRCDVVLTKPHRRHRHGGHYHVRIEVAVPGRMIEVSHAPGANGAHEDVYVAVRDAFHAAHRQLLQYVHADARAVT